MAGSWSPTGVPTGGDDVVIDAGAPQVSAADAVAGSIDVGAGAGLSVSGNHTLMVGATAASTIAADVSLTTGTLRLGGTTTWSAGSLQIIDTGVVENAGTLLATGDVSVAVFGDPSGGRRGFDVEEGGVTEVSGKLSVASEIDVDGKIGRAHV